MRVLASLVLLLAGCETEYPGTPVGAYAVTAELSSSTCGPGVGDASQRLFDVEVRRDDELAYWIGPDGVPLTGTIDEDGAFRFHIEQRILVREGDETLGLLPCVMDQVDEVTGTAARELDATETLYVATSEGADCSDQIGILTGTFLTLPCALQFDLAGVPQPDEG